MRLGKNGWLRYEEKKYIRKRMEHWRGDWEKREKKKQKEEHWEKRVNIITFYTNLVSSGELVESLIHICFLIQSLFFLVAVLRQSPLLLFILSSYKFYWFGPGLKGITHYSKWAWATYFSGSYKFQKVQWDSWIVNLIAKIS